jgi:hypothetical protein
MNQYYIPSIIKIREWDKKTVEYNRIHRNNKDSA